MTKVSFLSITKANADLKETVRNWRNLDCIRSFMRNQHIISEEEHLKWIENLKNENAEKFWVIFVDDVPVGSIYLQNVDNIKLSSEWGLYIGNDDYRGKGFGKYIFFEFFKMIFDRLNFTKLWARVLSANTPVLTLLDKFGYRVTGHSKDKNGKDVTEVEYLKDEWKIFKDKRENEFYN
jgi:UDP-4-amino-4,6-dideoxy-N-acetyl-beta-L-altrosamine N-acetyltransferase